MNVKPLIVVLTLAFSISACSPTADLITSSPPTASSPATLTPQASPTLTPTPTITTAASTIHTIVIESASASLTCPFDLVRVQHYEGSSYNVRSWDGTIDWEIPNTFTYVNGYSTFAWDASCKFLIHARADGASDGESGLYRLDLNSGEVEQLLALVASAGYGAVGPIALTNDDIVFTIQGVDATLYPPLGIYRLTSDGDLILLADIPSLMGSQDQYFLSDSDYGSLRRLPSGEFTYQSP